MKNIIKNNIVSLCLTLVFIIMYVLHIVLPDYIISKLFSSGGYNNLNFEFYRWITYAFLHSSIFHILGNILGLLSVGYLIEKKLGSLNYFILFIVGSFLAEMVFSLVFSDLPVNGVGASSAIYFLIGILMVVGLRYKEWLNINKKNIVLWIVIIYFIIGNTSKTAFLAHCIGFCIGILIGFVLVQVNFFAHTKKDETCNV